MQPKINVLSVGQAADYINMLLDVDDLLSDLWLQGEVSNVTTTAKGHMYFTLKDGGAEVRAAMWQSSVRRQQYLPKEGGAFVMHGKIEFYAARGSLQFIADLVQPVGVGKLALEFARLKQRLEDEGLFAEERKRPLPQFPRVIGVVTSPTAAAFQDIQNVLRRRWPVAQVILAPTLVQGDSAPPQIVAALRAINTRQDVDVVIVARGGGSLEELWAFNDERVARAVFASRIPVITGVGHEIDYTIVDYVADMRAPTPSAAAEIATPDRADLLADVRAMREGIVGEMVDVLESRRSDLNVTQARLWRVSPATRVDVLRERVRDSAERAERSLRHSLALRSGNVTSFAAQLRALNPELTLARGYAIVTDTDGRAISSVTHAQELVNSHKIGVTIRVKDGLIDANLAQP